ARCKSSICAAGSYGGKCRAHGTGAITIWNGAGRHWQEDRLPPGATGCAWSPTSAPSLRRSCACRRPAAPGGGPHGHLPCAPPPVERRRITRALDAKRAQDGGRQLAQLLAIEVPQRHARPDDGTAVDAFVGAHHRLAVRIRAAPPSDVVDRLPQI